MEGRQSWLAASTTVVEADSPVARERIADPD
jgi:hypothetical protein